MNEAILFTFANVDESRINTWENIFNSAQIDITDLVTPLGNN